MHVHTRFSDDSEALMEQYCDAALARGVGCVCFTDHVDLNPRDMGYMIYDSDGFFAAFERAKTRCGDKLRLLSGIEFGEPHIYQAEFKRYCALPYDFVMGSIHWWMNDMFPSQLFREGVPLADCFAHYWREVLDTVKYGGFDCLAHLDFPKRYYGDSIEDIDKLSDIFAEMVKRDIVLEINTSTLRKGMAQSMPDASLLRLYHAMGGRRVTVGSDAHAACDLAADAGYAKALINDIGLEEVVFIGRAAHNVS